jgi:hypothetical protein
MPSLNDAAIQVPFAEPESVAAREPVFNRGKVALHYTSHASPVQPGNPQTETQPGVAQTCIAFALVSRDESISKNMGAPGLASET